MGLSKGKVKTSMHAWHGCRVGLALVRAGFDPILHVTSLETEMQQNRNFFQRAVDAIVEGRSREAERYLARFDRDFGRSADKVNRR
jgi:hypothetical protein